MVNRLRIQEEFCRLVSVDSISFQEREIADLLTGSLKELGFKVIEDKAGDYYRGTFGNLYAYLEGEKKGEPILLSAHMDTVTPG